MADMADCSFEICDTSKGIEVEIHCFSDSLGRFLEVFIEELEKMTQNLDQKEFEIIFKNLKKKIKNMVRKTPDQRASSEKWLTLTGVGFLSEEYIPKFQEISFEGFQSWKKGFLSSSHLLWFLDGNIDQGGALTSLDSFESRFGEVFSPCYLPGSKIPQNRLVKMEAGSRSGIETVLQVESENNCALTTLHYLGDNLEDISVAILLRNWLYDSYYNDLRTE